MPPEQIDQLAHARAQNGPYGTNQHRLPFDTEEHIEPFVLQKALPVKHLDSFDVPMDQSIATSSCISDRLDQQRRKSSPAAVLGIQIANLENYSVQNNQNLDVQAQTKSARIDGNLIDGHRLINGTMQSVN